MGRRAKEGSSARCWILSRGSNHNTNTDTEEGALQGGLCRGQMNPEDDGGNSGSGEMPATLATSPKKPTGRDYRRRRRRRRRARLRKEMSSLATCPSSRLAFWTSTPPSPACPPCSDPRGVRGWASICIAKTG